MSESTVTPTVITSANVGEFPYNTLRRFASENGIKTASSSPKRGVLTAAIKRHFTKLAKGTTGSPAVEGRGRGRPALVSDTDFLAIWDANPNNLSGVVAALQAKGVKSKMGLVQYASARAFQLREKAKAAGETLAAPMLRGRKPTIVSAATVA